jgi:hypothetical protein
MSDHRAATGDREEAAAYLAQLSRDMALIARQHGFDALGFILEMARLEAENAIRHVNGRR